MFAAVSLFKEMIFGTANIEYYLGYRNQDPMLPSLYSPYSRKAIQIFTGL